MEKSARGATIEDRSPPVHEKRFCWYIRNVLIYNELTLIIWNSDVSKLFVL